jgi:hypothetical protein
MNDSVLERMSAILGKDHPESIEPTRDYGDRLTVLGDKDGLFRGYGLYMDAFTASLRRLGPEHPTTDNLIPNVLATVEEEFIFLEYVELKSHSLHV